VEFGGKAVGSMAKAARESRGWKAEISKESRRVCLLIEPVFQLQTGHVIEMPGVASD
jgi:hypothetical protein